MKGRLLCIGIGLQGRRRRHTEVVFSEELRANGRHWIRTSDFHCVRTLLDESEIMLKPQHFPHSSNVYPLLQARACGSLRCYETAGFPLFA
jgi:hypothetical protein